MTKIEPSGHKPLKGRKQRSLTHDDERTLARRARAGCRTSMDRIIEANLPYVIQIAREYRNSALPMEDLIAEGNMGLMEAMLRFDANNGCKFITYAAWWIRKAILSAISNQSRIVKIPAYHQSKRRCIVTRERELRTKLGREPTRAEVVAGLDGSLKKTDALLHFDPRELSLSSRTHPNVESRWSNRLAARNTPSPEDVLLRKENRHVLGHALRKLTAQERKVLSLRFGLEGTPAMTLGEIGSLMDLSRERIRQIENEGKARLRRYLKRLHAGRRIYPMKKHLSLVDFNR